MKTDNELIAEFMGLIPNPNDGNKTWTSDPQYVGDQIYGLWQIPKYDTSWDWLMPVVEKIGTYTLAYPERVKEVTMCRVIINHDALYRNCVEFIKWYNQQKS